jgi:hypothetical protein
MVNSEDLIGTTISDVCRMSHKSLSLWPGSTVILVWKPEGIGPLERPRSEGWKIVIGILKKWVK